MKKLTLALSAAALAMTGAGVAYADHHGGDKRGPDADQNGVITTAEHKAHAAKMFERMDANGDGTINAEDREARQAERFAKMDADGSGEVTQAEMQAAREARRERMQERREAMAERRAEGAADRGADRGAERFARLDTDNSGGLSQAELEAGRDMMRERRGERGERGERSEGRRGGDRKMRGHRGGQRGGVAMLRMADTDGDKSVSLAEFTAAADKRFAAMDANSDGEVTTEERKAAHEARKAQHMERRAARQAQ